MTSQLTQFGDVTYPIHQVEEFGVEKDELVKPWPNMSQLLEAPSKYNFFKLKVPVRCAWSAKAYRAEFLEDTGVTFTTIRLLTTGNIKDKKHSLAVDQLIVASYGFKSILPD